MILLLGGTGYIGEAFAKVMRRRNLSFISVSRKETDYTDFSTLLAFLRKHPVEIVINCAGYTGKPNVDACESARADTLLGNTILPVTIAQACAVVQIPYGHVSSGCIYQGAKVRVGNDVRIETDLMRPEMKALRAGRPYAFLGFTEDDPPNFSFRAGSCSFYSGTKALGEEAMGGLSEGYIWRLRIPFDEIDHERNYLSKVQRYAKVYDNVNSLSHRDDFAAAALDLWERRAPFGIYNLTNPGAIDTREVVGMIERVLKPARKFDFWEDDEEFYRIAARTPRSNCILDTTKVARAGIKLRPVKEALQDSLERWVFGR